MISVNDLRNGAIFEFEGAPWKVTKYEHSFKGRGRGKVTVRARNLENGNTREISFQSSENIEEADVERKELIYLYRTRDEAVFSYKRGDEAGEELFVPLSQVEWELNFLTKKQEIWMLFYEGKPISVQLPPTASLVVKKTDPGFKGDTVNNTLKEAILSTGYVAKVPLFIEEGEEVIIGTEEGEYKGRA